jgi:hypothetical protein
MKLTTPARVNSSANSTPITLALQLGLVIIDSDAEGVTQTLVSFLPFVFLIPVSTILLTSRAATIGVLAAMKVIQGLRNPALRTPLCCDCYHGALLMFWLVE